MSETREMTQEEAWKLIQDSGMSVLTLVDDVLHELFTELMCQEIIETILAEGAARALAKQEAGNDEKADPKT